MDVYDKAVKYYKKYPKRIKSDWNKHRYVQHGVLFKILGSPFTHGCITQIKSGVYTSQYLSITKGIMKDPKIPKYCSYDRFPLKQFMKSLHRFAYWNRKYDELEKQSKE